MFLFGQSVLWQRIQNENRARCPTPEACDCRWGPGGLEAAWIAASRGHNVVLFEKEQNPGGQFRIGAMPPGKQDLTKAINYYTYMGEKYGVDFRFGTEANADQVAAANPDVVIVATGAEPNIPDIPGIDNPKVVTAVDIISGKKMLAKKY